MTKCGSCGADIFWARTEAGKRIPIDALPKADGNLVVRLTKGTMLAIPLSKAGELGPDEVKHTSHFATCPDAASHRRCPVCLVALRDWMRAAKRAGGAKEGT